ncbi:hypothetical protein MFUM_1010013 [Methylacidiphilum fumariolicum SolV]|uniref:Uncharacterized protein n=2 Tax=Candidatus Methylacidiphilum fumarolicum TaxID=591154 RepID=I0JVC5_METFB|nr:conserved protein of unknown function [Candidatus Methylacidiphilum fumarolicum]CCG91194.1 hypothetical protein MFUM_1010013 [Methylacidiphilum fumariolicum SolV]
MKARVLECYEQSQSFPLCTAQSSFFAHLSSQPHLTFFFAISMDCDANKEEAEIKERETKRIELNLNRFFIPQINRRRATKVKVFRNKKQRSVLI